MRVMGIITLLVYKIKIRCQYGVNGYCRLKEFCVETLNNYCRLSTLNTLYKEKTTRELIMRELKISGFISQDPLMSNIIDVLYPS